MGTSVSDSQPSKITFHCPLFVRAYALLKVCDDGFCKDESMGLLPDLGSIVMGLCCCACNPRRHYDGLKQTFLNWPVHSPVPQQLMHEQLRRKADSLLQKFTKHPAKHPLVQTFSVFSLKKRCFDYEYVWMRAFFELNYGFIASCKAINGFKPRDSRKNIYR